MAVIRKQVAKKTNFITRSSMIQAENKTKKPNATSTQVHEIKEIWSGIQAAVHDSKRIIIFSPTSTIRLCIGQQLNNSISIGLVWGPSRGYVQTTRVRHSLLNFSILCAHMHTIMIIRYCIEALIPHPARYDQHQLSR